MFSVSTKTCVGHYSGCARHDPYSTSAIPWPGSILSSTSQCFFPTVPIKQFAHWFVATVTTFMAIISALFPFDLMNSPKPCDSSVCISRIDGLYW